MKILVMNVAAQNGGAMTVLQEFYRQAACCGRPDIQWYFILSGPYVQETENIRVLLYPWVKKSWLHRLFFDWVTAPGLVRSLGVDRIFSQQNLLVRGKCRDQILYLHQSIPFTEYRFPFRENPVFWVYQNILGRSMYRSVRKASKTIVQTQWMKEACVQKAHARPDSVAVVAPRVELPAEPEAFACGARVFFYPAAPSFYKNHRAVLEACLGLNARGCRDYRVVFTFTGEENEYARSLRKAAEEQKLPVTFAGTLTREQVFSYYSRAVLLFPSYVETFGLPLLECRRSRGMALASGCPFSHEVLDGYPNAAFFDPMDSRDLEEKMFSYLQGDMPYHWAVQADAQPQASVLDEVIGF